MGDKDKPIIVTVTDEMLENIDQVAEQLSSGGMKVDNVLPMTGVISGTCADSDISTLEQVEGVMSVEEEATATLPPPASDVQ